MTMMTAEYQQHLAAMQELADCALARIMLVAQTVLHELQGSAERNRDEN
jgi:hypothetical protein